MTTYLEFEKPIAELESKISELRHLPNSGDVDIAEEVMRLQVKVDKLLRATYAKLTSWQRVASATMKSASSGRKPMPKNWRGISGFS